jgi:hypothetical protein
MKRSALNEREKIFETMEAEKNGIMRPSPYIFLFNDEIRVEKEWKYTRYMRTLKF